MGKMYSVLTRLHRLKLAMGKMILFGCIFGICAALWNYVLYKYSVLFDTDLIAKTEQQQNVQSEILKSPIMWLVIFLWQWVNALTMFQYFTIAILYDRVEEFLYVMRNYGSLVVFTVAIISFLHYNYALNKIISG